MSVLKLRENSNLLKYLFNLVEQLLTQGPSRPSTQSNNISGSHLLWYPEQDTPERKLNRLTSAVRPEPDFLRIQPHAPNFSTSDHKFDLPLDTFRSQLNLSPFTLTNRSDSRRRASNTSFDPQIHTYQKDSFSERQQGSSSLPREWQTGQEKTSIFDQDIGDMDILKMAEKRDQQKGASRNLRGMMAPVISKDQENRSRSANRKGQLARPLSETYVSESRGSSAKEHEGLQINGVGINSEYKFANGEVKRSIGLDFLGERISMDDILAQSVLRSNFRGHRSKNEDSDFSPFNSGITDSTSYGSDNENDVIIQSIIPSSREDIQVLNLHGFMNTTTKERSDGLKASRSRRTKCPDGGDSKTGGHKRRKSKCTKSTIDERSGDITLRDIDDVEEKIGGIVLGPSMSKSKQGQTISLEVAINLRCLLMGNAIQPLPIEWMTQNFIVNPNPNISYGLIQRKGGPCGVLACVQAYIMKCLIYGSYMDQNFCPASPLRPSRREWQWALAAAIAEILWKAGQKERATLALPASFNQITEEGYGKYSRDGVTENLVLHEHTTPSGLYDAVVENLHVFTSESSTGCVLFLYSVILSRGIDRIQEDMDPGGGHIISINGYASQEIVNLMLTGMASTNTFDGEKRIGERREESMVLKGVYGRSEIGMLSLFEHFGSCKVGNLLKSPQYPIWVICSESHYSCVFSRDPTVVVDMPSEHKFEIYFYDGLSLQEDEIRLLVDLDSPPSDLPVLPPLELCLRTKWRECNITWHGSEPLL